MTTTATPTLDDLRQRIPGIALLTTDEELAQVSADDAEWAPAGAPLAALRARDAHEIERTVAACADLGIPVVPRGAGTGLSGGANAVDGCVIIDTSSMTRILEIDPDNLIAVVEPGVVNDDLKAAVAAQGLWYPPDPASSPWSTIGGNVATNAGGLCCLKYGVTRDYVLGLEAVVGGPAGYGTTVRLGRRTNKGVSGYDLTSLFVGSEGTLGVITQVTLRMRPAPTSPTRAVVGAFDSLVDAGRAVALVTQRGLTPEALELLDRSCLRAVAAWKGMGRGLDAEALLLARVDGADSAAEADAIAAAFTAAGARWATRSNDEAEADELFAARRLSYPALERLGPVLTEDICVPRSAVPEMLSRVEAIGRKHDVQIATIAHAGDGNLHPLLITPPDDDAARTAAQAAFEELLAEAVALGGTVSGEHGIGLLKRSGMQLELQREVRGMQLAVKQALDPLNLFNPGKVVGDDPEWNGTCAP